jgi:hypothetical protein
MLVFLVAFVHATCSIHLVSRCAVRLKFKKRIRSPDSAPLEGSLPRRPPLIL